MMMKKRPGSRIHFSGILLIALCLIIVIIGGCNVKSNRDGVFPGIKELDSLESERQLDNMLNGSYVIIDKNVRYSYPSLKRRRDIRYLPYIFLALTETHLPAHVTSNYNIMLYELCGMSKNDSLFHIGKLCTDILNKKVEKIYSDSNYYSFKDEDAGYRFRYRPNIETIGGELYDIDSLRIKVIGYNDRNALSLLEKYYKEINFEKELAAYYKVMLCYEGNGDLAERYYKVLKPYLAAQPEFLNSIREVLLRAALCDHNARAQELCDSLGFSLCDYRLPVSE